MDRVGWLKDAEVVEEEDDEEEESGGEGGVTLLPSLSGELGHENEELLGETGGVGGMVVGKSAGDSCNTWVRGASLLR